MESESVQNSKQDKVLKGTLEITKDNNKKLLLNEKIDLFLDGLKSTSFIFLMWKIVYVSTCVGFVWFPHFVHD